MCPKVHSSVGLGPGRPGCGLGESLTGWLASSRQITARSLKAGLGGEMR